MHFAHINYNSAGMCAHGLLLKSKMVAVLHAHQKFYYAICDVYMKNQAYHFWQPLHKAEGWKHIFFMM